MFARQADSPTDPMYIMCPLCCGRIDLSVECRKALDLLFNLAQMPSVNGTNESEPALICTKCADNLYDGQ